MVELLVEKYRALNRKQLLTFLHEEQFFGVHYWLHVEFLGMLNLEKELLASMDMEEATECVVGKPVCGCIVPLSAQTSLFRTRCCEFCQELIWVRFHHSSSSNSSLLDLNPPATKDSLVQTSAVQSIGNMDNEEDTLSVASCSTAVSLQSSEFCADPSF
ncbi:hypothetical protein AHAS_Ahas09G0039400 [Arachis hypogaea]|uniref:Uncharacterized protein n=1 Tax=Arachis hypogaea TaxID=3818 RepID=A0A445BNH5_ARAHY|nr:hypothetical protein Ahy_A09g045941 isoform B [Arachis hypogaea]